MFLQLNLLVLYASKIVYASSSLDRALWSMGAIDPSTAASPPNLCERCRFCAAEPHKICTSHNNFGVGLLCKEELDLLDGFIAPIVVVCLYDLGGCGSAGN